MLVVDLEYSGLDPTRHGIISLGAIDYLNPERTLYLECFLRAGAEFDLEAYAVHGLSLDYLSKLVLSEEKLVAQFAEWANQSPSHVLMGMAPQTDWEFLKAGFDRYELEWIFGHRSIDLHSLCVMHHAINKVELSYKYGVPDLSLDKISNYVGLPSRPGTHNALADARLTAECFARLMENKNLLPEFGALPIPKIQKKFGAMY